MPAISDVTCLFISYNSAGVLPQALAHVPKQCPVIIVDNASSDDSVAAAKAARPDAQVIEPQKNLGYGTAANRGITAATTPFVLLLNPDVLLQENTIPALLKTADTWPYHAIFGTRQFNREGEEQLVVKPPLFSAGHRLYKPLFRKDIYKATPATQPQHPAEVGWLCGSLMLFRKSVLEQKLGGFDENIFLFFEETDLCLRATKAGIPPVYVPDAVVTHFVAGSSAPEPSLNTLRYTLYERSRRYMAQKYKGHYPAWHRWYYPLSWRLKSWFYRGTRAAIYRARATGAQ